MIKIAVDVDGTLIGVDGKPNHNLIMALMTLARATMPNKVKFYVWSGGGITYAHDRMVSLGLHKTLFECAIMKDADQGIDISFDDMDITLAKVNIKV